MTDCIDISMEQYREYSTKSGAVYRVDSPVSLHITDSGSHRVVDAAGIVHRPPKFDGAEYAIRWAPKPGGPDFVA
jgi:hypothetical protein